MGSRDLAWQNRGNCNDPKIPTSWFYPDLKTVQNLYPGRKGEFIEAIAYGTARKICKTCPVKDACENWAMVNGEDMGMWGGLTPSERGWRA